MQKYQTFMQRVHSMIMKDLLKEKEVRQATKETKDFLLGHDIARWT